ncbi:MAG: 30S ribosomal protein S1 [Desulfobulbaceae bacterium]|nr:MAG: 30S ribosomal protein S1 [Desulfobulbaceae bacterium]
MDHENDSFEALLNQQDEKPLKRLSPGQKIQARVVGIDNETIFLDVGLKSEGIVNSSEFTDENGELTVAIDDLVTVYYLKSGGAEQLFTARIGSGADRAHLEEAYRSGVPVEGVVKTEIKGGFEITLSGSVRAFCPYSQLSIRRVDNPAEEYLGKTLNFLITKYSEGGRNLVVSARALQEEEMAQKREELKESLKVGDTCEGTIGSIQPFGLFVDIGGVDGLVPASEVGWSRVENLKETFSVGQIVSVMVKNLDWENNRITLSIKETLADPWEQGIATIKEGGVITGQVNRLAPFGAFIQLVPGVDGLLHISKLGKGRRINHPREVLEENQSVEVTIESIDPESRRISLAPSDYVSEEEAAEKERNDYRSYVSDNKKTEDSSMGSLGALLKAKLDEKKK